MFADKEIDWGKHDTVAIPNWSWHRHVNPGRERAVLFTMTDSPILTTLGFYRAETEDSAEALPPAQPAAKLSAAE
jgi:gentisate 1,2-dioxygenase